MGNGSSQAAELRKSHSFIDTTYKKNEGRAIKKYASPHHKVLPAPVLGQKLKNTHNGNVLFNGGTISGRKVGNFYSAEESDVEVLSILNKRSAKLQIKAYHSDPDLANRLPNDFDRNITNNNKNKYKKKKSKAPPPPPSENHVYSFTNDEPKSMYQRNEGYRRNRDSKVVEREKNAKNVARGKSPAPKPPMFDDFTKNNDAPVIRIPLTLSSPLVPMPPPPPPMATNQTSGKNVTPKYSVKPNDLNKPSSKCNQRDEGLKSGRNVTDRSHKLQESFHEDIKAALQKRLSSESSRSNRNGNDLSIKQYYFSGKTADETKINNVKSYKKKEIEEMEDGAGKPRQQYYFGACTSDLDTACTEKESKKPLKSSETPSRTTSKEIIKAVVQRTFSSSDNTQIETKRIEYNETSDNVRRRTDVMMGRRRVHSLSSSCSEDEAEIKIDLRPTVPGRMAREVPKFSPAAAWRSLSVDSAIRNMTNEVSSDETDANYEFSAKISGKKEHSCIAEDKSYDPVRSRYSQYESNIDKNKDFLEKENRKDSCERLGKKNNSKWHWTPEQDLSEDCESPTMGEKLSYRTNFVMVQPKLVTNNAFSSLPYTSYCQMPQNQEEWFPRSPSERVREKTKRTTRRKSKLSNKPEDNVWYQTNGLQNLKKSVRAAFTNNKKAHNEDPFNSTNWSLSRSIPGSLNELDVHSMPGRSIKEKRGCISSFQDQPEPLQFEHSYRSLPQLNRLEKTNPHKGHVIYLPEYKTMQVANDVETKRRYNHHDGSKYAENLTMENRKRWFLSTIETEMNEKCKEQPEWMCRVEEEFRIKRDREKANIRQQLRILNLEQKKEDSGVGGGSSSIEIPMHVEAVKDFSRQSNSRCRSRSEDLLSASPDLECSRKNFKAGNSYLDVREAINGPLSLPAFPAQQRQQQQLPPPPLDLCMKKRQMYFFDSPSSSSQASCNKKGVKGITKWFRKKHQPKEDDDDDDDNLPISYMVRPDPEGCRSSGDEYRQLQENSKLEKLVETNKKPSIYKQLNDFVERDEEKQRYMENYRRMNSAGESYSESDQDAKEIRPTSLRLPFGGENGSLTSSDGGNMGEFFSTSDRKKNNDDLCKTYLEYNGKVDMNRNKLSAVYAKPFCPSKGYRPVEFNPVMRSLAN